MERTRPGESLGARTGRGLPGIDRRTLLGMALAWALAPPRWASGAVENRKDAFTARAALLYGLLRFEETGVIQQAIDRAAGRYEIRITGRGGEMTTEIESTGVLRDGRWAPVRFQDRFVIHGRESRLEITYDYARGLIQYRGRSETFLLRRIRLTDDTLPLPAGVHVDDVVSASLNYSEGRWPPDASGALVTWIVRRRRGEREGPDDVERRYRAELVPFELRAGPEVGGRATALIDLTRFSSWAREDDPARIVFGADRRPESITATLILGTTLAITIGPVLAATS